MTNKLLEKLRQNKQLKPLANKKLITGITIKRIKIQSRFTKTNFWITYIKVRMGKVMKEIGIKRVTIKKRNL